MEIVLHIYNGLAVILLSLVLAALGWIRARRNETPPPSCRPS
jgi:hypothetical protein